jgi:NAD(P)-dependent dehydrogenase (short-subunit alcohol dehydrogenase family)
MEQKVALVTGGASGIGEEVCRLLAEHQFLVAVCDIDRDKAETVARSIGGIGVECDVASPQSVQSAASRCKAELGAPDFAHLNAGIMTSAPGEPYEPIETVPLDAYRKIMGVNLDGVFNGLQTFLPTMQERGGCITVTASIAGLGFVPVDPLYTATKHAVIGLTRAVAAANAGSQVRINAICPGVVDTAIVPPDFKSRPMMPARMLAEEVVDLYENGQNGEVRVKIAADRPSFVVEPVPL